MKKKPETVVNTDYKKYSMVKLAAQTGVNPAALVAVIMAYIKDHEDEKECTKHVFTSTIVFVCNDGIPHKAITLVPSPDGQNLIDFHFNEAVRDDLVDMIRKNKEKHKNK